MPQKAPQSAFFIIISEGCIGFMMIFAATIFTTHRIKETLRVESHQESAHIPLKVILVLPLVVPVVKIVEAQIIIKPMQPFKMAIIR